MTSSPKEFDVALKYARVTRSESREAAARSAAPLFSYPSSAGCIAERDCKIISLEVRSRSFLETHLYLTDFVPTRYGGRSVEAKGSRQEAVEMQTERHARL